MGILFQLAEFLRLIFLFIALGFLLLGLYETGASMYYFAQGSPVEGTVVSVRKEGGGRYRHPGTIGYTYADPFQFPTIEYRWPDRSGETYQIEHFVPRELSDGDRVTVRVLSSSPAAGRADLSWIGHLFSVGMLLFGLIMTTVIYYSWHGLNQIFGRAVPEAGLSMFSGRNLWRVGAVIGIPILVICAIFAYYVPWFRPSDYDVLTSPRSLLIIAEERGGAPVSGRFNEYELRLLSLPFGAGRGAATRAFEYALREAGDPRLQRYLAALGDPASPFRIEVYSRILWDLVERQPPELMAQFLDTGIALDAGLRTTLLEAVQSQPSEQKETLLRLLSARGINPP
jgi:hypothetical protein